jgi:hypothetical protein
MHVINPRSVVSLQARTVSALAAGNHRRDIKKSPKRFKCVILLG